MQLRFCALLALLIGVTHSLAADILYSVTDLGDLGGGFTSGYGINNLGQVAGDSGRIGFTHAFLYSNGQIVDLDTFGRHCQVCANK